MAQTATEGFDLLLVSGLLALGKFEGFEHFFHVVQRRLEGFDDMINLFDCLLDGHGFRRAGGGDGGRGRPRLGGDRFGKRRAPFGHAFDGLRRLFRLASCAAAPTTSASAATASATSGGLRGSRLLGCRVFLASWFFGCHACFNVP